MERIHVTGDERNGSADDEGNEHEIEFYGDEIAVFRLPNDGKERMGSIGIDFTLYKTYEGGLVLIVENWSLREGGKNCRSFETFDSIEKMDEKVLYEDFYTVEMPRKLIDRARRKMLTREI